jgi:hypothetical protein
MSVPTIPSPIPPWDRSIQSPLTQTLTGEGIVDLTKDVTYLNSQVHQTGDVPYAVDLPDGDFPRRIHRIFIFGAALPFTASFRVSGNFAGAINFLNFSSIATSAMLEWDGTCWQLIGGNAQPTIS